MPDLIDAWSDRCPADRAPAARYSARL